MKKRVYEAPANEDPMKAGLSRNRGGEGGAKK